MNAQAKVKIYISLPITGHPRGDVLMRAGIVKCRLESLGFEVVNPLEVDAGESPEYFDHIAADLRALADCDAIYMCRGWRESRGCRLEHAFARIYQLQFHYEPPIFRL